MKINLNILSIPPYLSTAWKNIASLHLENHARIDVLIVTLHSGARIEIPGLEAPLIEAIFSTHLLHLEQEEKAQGSKAACTGFLPGLPNNGHFSLELLALENPLANLTEVNAISHDPTQANNPKLPQEILERISQISQAMGIDDPQALPQPEADCNCMRCQIARALQESLRPKTIEEPQEELVSDEELSFSTWNVTQKTETLYIVTNPLEDTEQYQVHLGNPIGCTCGNDHCEHIKAVLNT